MKWIYIKLGDYNTYPQEGCPVVVSDDTHYDIAWFLMSGDYKWVKDDLKNDELMDFTNFVIIKWAYIE